MAARLTRPPGCGFFFSILIVAPASPKKILVSGFGAKNIRIWPKLQMLYSKGVRQSDLVAKWVGLSSGIVGLLLAIPVLVNPGQEHWLRWGLVAVAVISIAIFALYLRPEPYDLEFVDHEIDLDFKDPNAKTVIQTRTTKLRAISRSVDSITDHMSADGGMNEPEVSPGVVMSLRREGGDLFVTSSLGRVLRKGEEIKRTLKTVLSDSFPAKHEYWNIRISHPMEKFVITLKFQHERPPKSYRGVQRVSTYEKTTDTQPTISIEDGRPTLRWEVDSPRVRYVYKIEWDW